VALAAALFVVFVGFRAQRFVNTSFDPYYFGKMGTSIARGDGFLPFGTLIQRRAPLYPLLIGGVYWAFGERPLLVLLLHCALHVGTTLFLFSLTRRLFGKRAAVIAGVLCAMHPMLLRYVPDLHLETLFAFLVTLTVWLTERFARLRDIRSGALLGLSFGLASLTKSVILLYPGLFAMALAYREWRVKEPLPIRGLATMFLTMALTISPWTLRNYDVTGHFVPISSGLSDAYLRGLIFSRTEFITLREPPYEVAENESNAYFARLGREAGPGLHDDWEWDQIMNREMKRRFFAEPALNVRRFFVGIFTFWYQMTSLPTSLVAGGLAAIAWLFAAFGLKRAYHERRPAWIVLLPVVYLNLLLAALLALGRYSMPVTPCLIALAAYGIDSLLPRRESRAA